ncbi:Uncharacterised protein [Shewanella baltica]|nr:Uncharacterised protein [Shewanella baltica]
MGTQKKDLTMRDCKNRYSESDLPRLIQASKPTILRSLLTNLLLPKRVSAERLPTHWLLHYFINFCFQLLITSDRN